MSNSIQEIFFRKTKTNPTLSYEYADYELPFYKSEEVLNSLESFVSFVKGVEKIVRISPYYSRYVDYIKRDIGLDMCQVLSNIKEEEKGKVKVEMHHGPMLTLFDYAAIITDSYLNKGKKINSFIIAQAVIDEHFENNVQVVMLSKTVHQAVHSYGGIFIDHRQGFGDVSKFLSKYKDGVSEDILNKINNYIEAAEKYGSFDRDMFTLKDNVKKWADHYDFYLGDDK